MVVKAHSDHISSIQYINSMDRIVSASQDGRVCLLDLATKHCEYYHGHSKAIHTACYVTTMDYFASAGQEREIHLWSPYRQKYITSLVGHLRCVKSIVFDETHNYLISMSIDKQVIVWDPKSYERLSSVMDVEHLYRPENTFTCMLWDEERKKMLVTHSRLQAWPTRDGLKEGQGLVKHNTRSIIQVGLCNNSFGTVLTIDDAGLVLVWKLDNGMQLSAFPIKREATEKVSAAVFDNSERRLLVGTSKGRVWIYNWNSGVRLNELESDMDSEVTSLLNTMQAAKSTEVARGYTVATGWNRFVKSWPSFSLAPILGINYV